MAQVLSKDSNCSNELDLEEADDLEDLGEGGKSSNATWWSRSLVPLFLRRLFLGTTELHSLPLPSSRSSFGKPARM